MRTHGGITAEQLLGWEELGFFEMKEAPKWKRADDTHPTRIYVLCDDVFGSPMLRMGKGQGTVAEARWRLSGSCTVWRLKRWEVRREPLSPRRRRAAPPPSRRRSSPG